MNYNVVLGEELCDLHTMYYIVFLLTAYQPTVEPATGLLTVAVPLHVAQSEGGRATVNTSYTFS